jgi:hypothetical protein
MRVLRNEFTNPSSELGELEFGAQRPRLIAFSIPISIVAPRSPPETAGNALPKHVSEPCKAFSAASDSQQTVRTSPHNLE